MSGCKCEWQFDYWVRHAESGGGSRNVFQTRDEVLTERGKQQADLLGRLFASNPDFKADRIVTSSLPRALQTTEAITRYVDLPVTVSPFYVERENSPYVAGKPKTDEQARRIADMIAHYGGLQTLFPFFGGETPYGNYLRCCHILHYRNKMPETRVLHITHGGTMKTMLYLMMNQGGLYNFDQFKQMDIFDRYINNASITTVKRKPGSSWERTMWNYDLYLPKELRS